MTDQLEENTGDPHRPGFHFMPPANWMNEPHAAFQYRGLHHIFYQRNPRGPFWDRIHWGHAVSHDLVNWRHLPDALTPDTVAVAPDGVWSGSATRGPDGSPVLFFTAGDNRLHPNQSIGLATPAAGPDGADSANQLSEWRAVPEPVVRLDTGLDTGYGPPLATEFRDPFVWRDGDEWFMLVGSGVGGVGGTALLYVSQDLVTWAYAGPLLVGDVGRLPATGVMWELPNLLPVSGPGGDRHVFIMSPWWPDPTEYSLRYAWYWIGSWDARARRFTPDHDEPRHFDYGGYFTGPTGTVDESGRTLLWSIAQDGRTDDEHRAAGWAHNAGLPLELSLGADGELRIAPVRELARLRRGGVVDLREPSLDNAAAALAAVRTDMAELELEAVVPGTSQLQVEVRRTPDGAEKAMMRYHAGERRIEIEVDGVAQGGPLTLDGDRLRLRVFVDRSMVEAYVNGHRSLTSRIYPRLPEKAQSMGISASAGVTLNRVRVWPLDPARNVSVPP
ncbi:glycoside hydrolase family 32 protein [Phytoactinopolyspora mesophila]|uniref:beta-fructofuranosidase n=1 Tax=Phytoactinopolyspora mesophila TaxID=2650750 RepID=A0A7K3M9B7_9ACTN|nr:glycoside hydrolase family 32 protein [Phytoactinopolyspora mesophila]NDL59873.1 glycoside hydrolase family 32 protein [Phytoactinopolyspora mesophila]